MKSPRAVIGVAAIVAVYVLGCRPWMMRWGSTPAERDQLLPGDEIIQTPAPRATRAIDIMSPPSDVWPWHVQLGYGPGRAGSYSYDWLENLIGLDIHSAARIIPELQQMAVGDSVPFGPETDLRVELIEPHSALVLHVRMHPFTGRDVLDSSSRLWLDWTWSFVLLPKGQATRLLVRTRGAWSHRLSACSFSLFLSRSISSWSGGCCSGSAIELRAVRTPREAAASGS